MVIWLCHTIHYVIYLACLLAVATHVGRDVTWYKTQCHTVILLRLMIAATKMLRHMIISEGYCWSRGLYAHSAQCILAKAGSLTEATSGVFCAATQQWEKQRENLPSVTASLGVIRDFKIQQRGRDQSRPEVKIPKWLTRAHDRDVNKSRPCSRRTRRATFSRCQQTVSISTYFNNKTNWIGTFSLYIESYIVLATFVMFFFVFSCQALSNFWTKSQCHGLELQTAVSRFLRCSFNELRLKNK